MEKRGLSIIIVLATVFSVGAMLYGSDLINFKTGPLFGIGNISMKNIKNKSEPAETAAASQKKLAEEKVMVNAEPEREKDQKHKANSERGSKELDLTIEGKKSSEGKAVGGYSVNLQSTEVFKVTREVMEKEMSEIDRKRLLSFKNKISPSDYAKINNYLKEDGEIEGIIKTAALLRKRLTYNDYKMIREAAEKYFYVDNIEKAALP
jgi:hypothetical protein